MFLKFIHFLSRLRNLTKIENCLIFIFITVVSHHPVFAGSNVSKSGTVAALILEIPASPRGMALGNAVIANSADIGVFYWNPALATNYKHITMGGVNTPWLLGTHFNYFSVIVPTPALTIGAYLSTWSMPDMDVRTEYYPEGTGEKFNAGDFVIGLSVARSLTDHFGIGGSIKYIQERIWHSSSNSIALDFGSIFTIDIGNGVRIGAVLKNYGTEMRLKGRDMYHYHDPNEEIDGNDENIISGYITDSWMLPLLFKIGISTDIINSKRFKWVVEIDGKHPSNNYESLDCGTELEINNIFFIRIGAEKIFLKDEEISFCSGFGIRLPILTKPCFDYAFKDYNDIGVIHSLALEFGF
ncbi:MAG: PorV/PorQ family protein [Candidatus Marinimicrobia bacterium]|nr:PorV/PorQ family protein [Candidatus Neomarinimicrobiota bacterium]